MNQSSRTAVCILAPRRWLALALLGVATSACPDQASAPPAPDAPCREVGQRCEFAPGKLGSCVLDDNCKGSNCYVCQSQH
jgi:hypothetical protein